MEIFLELIEEALLSTVEIGHDARMNRQDRVLVVGVGCFDLTPSGVLATSWGTAGLVPNRSDNPAVGTLASSEI
jgi:hypothetical protein